MLNPTSHRLDSATHDQCRQQLVLGGQLVFGRRHRGSVDSISAARAARSASSVSSIRLLCGQSRVEAVEKALEEALKGSGAERQAEHARPAPAPPESDEEDVPF